MASSRRTIPLSPIWNIAASAARPGIRCGNLPLAHALQRRRCLVGDSDRISTSPKFRRPSPGAPPRTRHAGRRCHSRSRLRAQRDGTKHGRATLDFIWGLSGRPISGTKIDWVFIGYLRQCSSFRFAGSGRPRRNRHVFPGVTAWVVPGSEDDVKRQAERLKDLTASSVTLASNGGNLAAVSVHRQWRASPARRARSFDVQFYAIFRSPGPGIARISQVPPWRCCGGDWRDHRREEAVNMQAFTRITGPAAPLDGGKPRLPDIVIIRIERLTSGADLARYALEALRYQPRWLSRSRLRSKRTTVLQPILLAGRNFGCGSSRAGAVTALMAMGVHCVIAPSFGDIFFGNCFQNGLLPVILPEEQVAKLPASARKGGVTVDLQRCMVISPEGTTIYFAIDALRRKGACSKVSTISA